MPLTPTGELRRALIRQRMLTLRNMEMKTKPTPLELANVNRDVADAHGVVMKELGLSAGATVFIALVQSVQSMCLASCLREEREILEALEILESPAPQRDSGIDPSSVLLWAKKLETLGIHATLGQRVRYVCAKVEAVIGRLDSADIEEIRLTLEEAQNEG